jgi:soluble lytic murein transglycosylase-like protein
MAEANATQHDEKVLVRAANGHNDRRNGDRRRHSRFGGERRRGDRRRKTIRTVLLTAAAMSASPSAINHLRHFNTNMLRPMVTVSMSDVVPLEVPRSPQAVFENLIQEAALAHNLEPALIRAVMRTESAFNPRAVSPVGAMGLMQLMPALAKEMGVQDPWDPRQNIMGGAKYLRRLLDSHKGNVKLALASYNAGPGNVRRYKGIPPFKETRNYVKKITDILETAE